MIEHQIFDMVNIGIVILDNNFEVKRWNRWMDVHSNISAKEIIGTNLFDSFPNLNNPSFLRKCKSVFTFGNFIFFSRKLHKYLFPFNPVSALGIEIDKMQQNCTMGPLLDENNKVKLLFITVQDVTDIVMFEQKLIEMNKKDALTGIFNRRYFAKKLQEEFKRFKRYKRPFGLLMCDLDLFKQINDSYGHQCGDKVLQEVAALIASELRETDLTARYGGEEFCCLLVDTNSRGVQAAAERIRESVEKITSQCKHGEVQITISVGLAISGAEDDTPEKMIARADNALYKAKANGRNRVEIG